MDSGINEVKVYGFDPDLKCIQPLPIKNGAVQVASVYNPATVDALNNNLFRITATGLFSTSALVLANAAGTAKIIQIVSATALITAFSGSPTVRTVQLSAYVGTGMASAGAVNTVNVLTNANDPRAGITAYTSAAALGAFIGVLGGTTQAIGVDGLPVTFALQQNFPFINSSVPVFATQNSAVAFRCSSSVAETVTSVIAVYYKLIDV